jgi:hypothetical protein
MERRGCLIEKLIKYFESEIMPNSHKNTEWQQTFSIWAVQTFYTIKEHVHWSSLIKKCSLGSLGHLTMH